MSEKTMEARKATFLETFDRDRDKTIFEVAEETGLSFEALLVELKGDPEFFGKVKEISGQKMKQALELQRHAVESKEDPDKDSNRHN